MSWNSVLGAACWASGHLRYQFDRLLQANERLEPQVIDEMQWGKLKRLIWYAYASVPYYRSLFEGLKITPDDIRTREDFAGIPVLTKSILREQGVEQFRSRAYPRSSLQETATSGSTGEPLRFLRERDYEEWRMAGSWRAWRWGGWHLGEKIGWVWREYWDHDPMTRLSKRVNWWFTRRRLWDVSEMSEGTLNRWTAELQAFRPRFLHGFPSAMERLARYLDETGRSVGGVQAVFCNGEKLQPAQRELIGRVFQARVHDVYGSSEVHPIAAECRNGALHVSTDLLVSELVDDPKILGLKRIVLTPLHAFGMPLLRYEVGDLALPDLQTCSCGLPFPVLEGLIGRSADLFSTPDGRVVHGQVLIGYLSRVEGIERFQFLQQSKENLHLFLVKGRKFDPRCQHQLEEVLRKIRRELAMPVVVEDRLEIPRTIRGKFRYAVSELPG